jgi:hypothetical protein
MVELSRACLELQGTPRDTSAARDVLRAHALTAAQAKAIEDTASLSDDAAATSGVARFDADAWLQHDACLLDFDRRVHAVEDRARSRGRSFCIRVRGRGPALARAAVGVANRYQRLWPVRNEHSRQPYFDQVLRAHLALHDCEKPLVRADYEHALDVWQWVLRLCPHASGALQVAALFHDVERLVSEADVRVEQHASDYLSFKQAHAARGADLLAAALVEVCEPQLLARAGTLVARHEQPGRDAELRYLNDADALSFFSLNSPGFLSYYGPAHSAMKIRYTVGRMRSEDARLLLCSLRLVPFIAEQMAAALEELSIAAAETSSA